MDVSENDVTVVDKVQDLLRRRLCARRTPALIHGYQEERAQLLDLLKRTSISSESNSILVVGARGSGKTMLLRSVLQELTEIDDVRENMMQVHLNGLLQTNDRVALQEITRQLQLENVVGDKVFGSFAENLQFLLDALKSGSKKTKSILFVLDEFDLFAHHRNQTLLYNLFDVSQSAQTPICVIGLTVRLDVIELLEKRVKSRFSHRQLHLLPAIGFADYLDMFVSSLSLPDSFEDRRFAKSWAKRLKELRSEPVVVDVLRRRYNINRDISSLQNMLVLPVCRLSPERPLLEAADIVDSSKLIGMDSKAAMLHGISVLELCLVIAMRHLTETYDSEPFNFEMVFKEYSRFAQCRSSVQIYEKAVVLKAFEHLVALELVQPVEGGSSRTQKEYRSMNLLVDSSQVTEAILRYPHCPTEVRQWASCSVVS